MNKIPFYIISGFLGSGKTTLLKRIIEKYAPLKKIGIIQNEFAPVNIDSKELKATGKDFALLEVNNGSVFCVCLLGDFVNSLEAFIRDYRPEMLVMEASGLSDTTSVAEILSAPGLTEKIFLAGTWCIVDAFNYYKAGQIRQRLVHQIRMADTILINKTDLAGDSIPSLKEAVGKINPFAAIAETTFCNVDLAFDISHIPKYYFDSTQPLERPAINSMVIKSGKKISLPALELFIGCWKDRAYRIKGFVNLTDGTTLAIQCTFDQIEIRKVNDINGPTELIALSDQFTLHEWNRSFRDFCSAK